MVVTGCKGWMCRGGGECVLEGVGGYSCMDMHMY